MSRVLAVRGCRAHAGEPRLPGPYIRAAANGVPVRRRPRLAVPGGVRSTAALTGGVVCRRFSHLLAVRGIVFAEPRRCNPAGQQVWPCRWLAVPGRSRNMQARPPDTIRSNWARVTRQAGSGAGNPLRRRRPGLAAAEQFAFGAKPVFERGSALGPPRFPIRVRQTRDLLVPGRAGFFVRESVQHQAAAGAATMGPAAEIRHARRIILYTTTRPQM